MKVFWAIIAALVLAAAWFALSPGEKSRRDTPSHLALADAAPPRATPPPAPEPRNDPAPPAGTPEPAQPTPADPAPAGAAEPALESPPEPPVEPEPEPEPEPAPLPDALEQLVTDTLTPGPDAEPSAEPAPLEAPADPSADAAPAPADPAPALAETTIVRQPDGSQLINNRFILRGEGTKEKPYEITWDMLVAVQEVYKPRLGQKTLPGYLDIIDGAYVKIAGYIAFPLMAQSPDEMLVMLNQWDGCCIGIPPTPYDAIEVRLRTPAEGETRFKISGAVTGRIAVDPYLVKDWLIGLYTMDDAVLTTDD